MPYWPYCGAFAGITGGAIWRGRSFGGTRGKFSPPGGGGRCLPISALPCPPGRLVDCSAADVGKERYDVK